MAPPPLPLLLLLSGAILLPLPSSVSASRSYPQYLVLNKANFAVDPWAWDQDTPGSASQASITNLTNTVALTAPVSESRRLAVSHIVLVTGVNSTHALQFLDNQLALALANDLPISVELDVFQWWNGRQDLWNWFNESAPGYDPGNVANVEWTGWSPDNATMLSWRDWGSQFRTPAPHPNIASPLVLSTYVAELRPYLARVSAWYAGLAPGQRYLLAAVKLSEEVDIGPNFYFYEDGNSYISAPPADDPKTIIAGAVQLGFNAVCTAGLACSGEGPTPDQLDTVVQAFYSLLAQAALEEGLPRGKLMSHCGSNFDDMPTNLTKAWNTGEAAITSFTAPAWSIYSAAADPGQLGPHGLDVALDALGGSQWGIGEWYCFTCAGDKAAWGSALANSFAYRNSRLVHVFNYEAFYRDGTALEALRAFLDPAAAPACLVEPASGVGAQVLANGSVLVTWSAGPMDADAAYIDVSTLSTTLPSAALAVPDIVSHAPVSAGPGGGSFVFTPPPNAVGGAGAAMAVYVNIVASGCASSPGQGGQPQAMASDTLLVPIQ
jgi:hypothetical protein